MANDSERSASREAQRRGDRPTHPGYIALGNLLIIVGLALLGGTVTIAASGGLPEPDLGADVVRRILTAEPATSPWLPALQAGPLDAGGAGAAADVDAAQAPDALPKPTPSVDAPVDGVRQPPAAGSDPARPKVVMPRATHLRIPAVGIDTDVVEVGYDLVQMGGQTVIQWQVADYAAGHHSLSANPGEGGNIVITGHDDWRGAVFRTLEKADVGDQVVLSTSRGEVRYVIAEIHYRRELNVPLADRLATGTFLAPMPEERLTLVTCWPYGVNDHRLIVVAKPIP